MTLMRLMNDKKPDIMTASRRKGGFSMKRDRLRAVALLLILCLLITVSVSAEERSLSWAQELVGLQSVRDMNLSGEGIRVAIIDSGLSADFAAMDGIHVENATNYLVAEDHADRCNVTDHVGHGTAVASIIADPTIGLAPGVTLVPLKCFDKGTGSFDPIVKAVSDAVDTYDCDVINMSLGSTTENAALASAVQHALDSGVIVVAAVGNYAFEANTYFYPAAQKGVISVGAVDSSGSVINTSVRNDRITVVAPGRDVPIFSSQTGSYSTGGGTSYAAPFVTAAAALARSIDSELTPAEFQAMLQDTANDGGTEGYDTSYGYGLLNLPALFSEVMDEPSHVSYNPISNAVTIKVDPPPTVEVYSLFLVFYDGHGRLISTDLWSERTEALEKLQIPLPKGCTTCKLLVVDPDFSPILYAKTASP